MPQTASKDFYQIPSMWDFFQLGIIYSLIYLFSFGSDAALECLWPVGSLLNSARTNRPELRCYLVYLLIIVHAMETMYALKLCIKHQFSPATCAKWCVSTVLCGIYSLRILMQFDKEEIKKTE